MMTQSQVKIDTALFCDLKTDEEKSIFFLSGRGYETGVIAQAIQNDVAMAYHRCSENRKALEALQTEREKLEKALDQLHDAAGEFSADQSIAADPRCAVTQPVTVEDAHALNAALSVAAALLKEKE